MIFTLEPPYPSPLLTPRCVEDLFVHRDALLQQFQDVELTAGTVVEFDVERDHHKKSVLLACDANGRWGHVEFITVVHCNHTALVIQVNSLQWENQLTNI